MTVRIVIDKKLHRTGSQRTAFTVYRGRHQLPPQRFARQVCGDFAARQTAGRKIPQGLLAAHRLVHHPHRAGRACHFAQKGVV
jgi:hypothetical protein